MIVVMVRCDHPGCERTTLPVPVSVGHGLASNARRAARRAGWQRLEGDRCPQHAIGRHPSPRANANATGAAS